MALVFRRRLAIPVWAVAFFAVALAASPPATLLLMPRSTLFVVALGGIAVLLFAMPAAFPWLRPSRSLARVRPSIHSDEDALDLVRMDDDGGWQMARPQI